MLFDIAKVDVQQAEEENLPLAPRPRREGVGKARWSGLGLLWHSFRPRAAQGSSGSGRTSLH